MTFDYSKTTFSHYNIFHGGGQFSGSATFGSSIDTLFDRLEVMGLGGRSDLMSLIPYAF